MLSRALFASLALLSALPLRADLNPAVVISQVQSSFIEIFNRSANPVSIDGWSIQYEYWIGGLCCLDQTANWEAIPLYGTLQPGQHFLAEVDGLTWTNPDISFSFNFPYIRQGLFYAGTIAIVRNTTLLDRVWPSTLDVVDLFGYGKGVPADGTSFPPFDTWNAVRIEGGCFVSHNNATDFALDAPPPRSTRYPPTPCSTAPAIGANGIVSSATFSSGPIAPGELLTIFGSHLGPDSGLTAQLTTDKTHVTTQLGGVQVFFGATPAPILYASASQVNVVAPFALSGTTQTNVRVAFNGVSSAGVALTVVPAAPGIFTALGTGTGQAAALNQDTTPNRLDTPAQPNSVVTIYATGAGQTSAAGEDGRITSGTPPTPILPVSITIGGQNAKVVFAGSAPGLVSGVIQVNAQIPAGLVGRQQLALKVGTASSQAGATLMVFIDAPPPLSDYVRLDTKANSLAYDPGTNRLYASVGSDAPSDANSILILDPSSGAVIGKIPTAVGPGMIALSDDGQYLYLALLPKVAVSGAIARINLSSLQTEFTVSLDDIYSDQPIAGAGLFVNNMVALPGQPRSVAIEVGDSSWQSPLAILDDNRRRPGVGPPSGPISTGGVGVLWGGAREYFTTAAGVVAGPFYPVPSLATGILPAGDGLVSAQGAFLSGDGQSLRAQFDFPGATSSLLYRPDTGLAYYVGWLSGGANMMIESFDLQSYMPAGIFFSSDSTVPPSKQLHAPPGGMISVGKAGFALLPSVSFGESGNIFLIPLSLVAAAPPVVIPQAPETISGLTHFKLPTVSISASPTGDTLYLSTSADAPPIGNSIVPFDVRSQTFGAPVWVGSAPYRSVASADGRYLHVILSGSRSVARLSLPSLSIEKQFPIKLDNGLWYYVCGVVGLVSNPTSVAVARCGNPPAVYDDGVRRPTVLPSRPVTALQLSADGNVLYGEEESGGIVRWNVTPTGLTLDKEGPNLFSGVPTLDFKCQRSLCLTGMGDVIDPNTLQRIASLRYYHDLGIYSNEGLVIPDLDNNRIYMLDHSPEDANHASQVVCYDATTYQMIGRFVVHVGSALPIWHSFLKVAGDQLAFADQDGLWLLPISSLQAP